MIEKVCSTCKKYPAIIETIPCRIDETREYEQWLAMDGIDFDEDEFIALRDTIDRMREKLDTVKNASNWDGNHRIFTRENIYSCRKCQKEQDVHYQIKIVIPQRLVEAGVKKEYMSASLEDCGSWLQAYVDRSLFIYGTSGTGKTHAIVALLRDDAVNNKSVAFTTVFDLLQKIKTDFSKESQIIEYYSTIPNLYLDDVGMERLTDWALPILLTIIDNRYGNRLRTVFTSNKSLPELREILGDRLISRILGICGKPKKLTGEDRRRIR